MTKYLRDLAERVGMTFLGAFGASLILANWFTVDGIRDVSTLGQAGLAGVAAVLSLVKGLVAARTGRLGVAGAERRQVARPPLDAEPPSDLSRAGAPSRRPATKRFVAGRRSIPVPTRRSDNVSGHEAEG